MSSELRSARAILHRAMESLRQARGEEAAVRAARELEQSRKDRARQRQEAFDAIGRLDYDAAIAAYTNALNENPRDELAISGLAQVKLLKRTDGKNPNDLPSTAPESLEQLLEWADVMASVGNSKAAFDALLDAFASKPEDRDALRKHLIELFATVDPSDEVLIAARKRLATLLY